MGKDVKHDAYSKEHKPEDMSEDEWLFIREEGMDDNTEAVTKAGMMYRFDGCWFLEEDFVKAIVLIWEDDIVWKDYIHFLDNFPETDWEGNTALFKIASAIMWCYRRLTQINLEVKEVFSCVDMLRTTLQMYVEECFDEVFSEEELTQWGRNRKNWLPFEVAYVNYLGQEEMLNKDKGD